MKKVISISLTLALLACFVIFTTASAEPRCLHPSFYTYYTTGPWKALTAGSPAYASEHYRNHYMVKSCTACDAIVSKTLDFTEFGDHSLPCGACGAR